METPHPANTTLNYHTTPGVTPVTAANNAMTPNVPLTPATSAINNALALSNAAGVNHSVTALPATSLNSVHEWPPGTVIRAQRTNAFGIPNIIIGDKGRNSDLDDSIHT